MVKFHVVGDNQANPFYSSSLIIAGLNGGAKEAGLYDENGKCVVYSTTANDYGYKADAIFCVYEASLPTPVLRNAAGRPLIGCSLHNNFFITDVYPSDLAGFSQLGVDSSVFVPKDSSGKRDKVRFLCLAESNVRSGIDVLLEAFAEEFAGNNEVELYLKDRGATPMFQEWVKNFATLKKANIIHDTKNSESFDDVLALYHSSDYLVFVSRSTTWGMPMLEAMACGLPVITTPYAGAREYMADTFNGLAVEYTIKLVEDSLVASLEQRGYRNHMFSVSNHLSPPYWAEPDRDNLRAVLKASVMVINRGIYPALSRNAIITAKHYTWKRAAVNLSCTLSDLEKAQNNP